MSVWWMGGGLCRAAIEDIKSLAGGRSVLWSYESISRLLVTHIMSQIVSIVLIIIYQQVNICRSVVYVMMHIAIQPACRALWNNIDNMGEFQFMGIQPTFWVISPNYPLSIQQKNWKVYLAFCISRQIHVPVLEGFPGSGRRIGQVANDVNRWVRATERS